jgi:hypothetical protein
MPARRVGVGIETTPKKVFASALEWPGWSRAGKDRDAALASLAEAATRYARVAKLGNVAFDADGDNPTFEVVEEAEGNATTAFGAPDVRFEADHRPTTKADAERLAALLQAAWKTFDRVVAGAPAELRKGPRGGGRDRDKIVEHVHGADEGYAQVMGLKPREHPSHDDLRAAILAIVGEPSDGKPLAGRKWPVRYAARRLGWHALDHAWEIEDRSTPDD